MWLNGRRTVRSLGEFLGLLALVLGGALAVTWLGDRVAGPAGSLVDGAAILGLAVAGILWLERTATADSHRVSGLAGLGGAVGALVATQLLAGDAYGALGAGLGAGLFGAAGILWGGPPEQSARKS